MKTSAKLLLLTALTLGAGLATSASATTSAPENVTVTFHEPEKFTDAGDRHNIQTSEIVLDELRDYLQQTAASRLPAGCKLSVTFLDIDLAGMIRPDKDNIRIMTGTTIPRMHLKFELLGADGQVLQVGERRISDIDYQQNIQIIGRNEPLFYDKQLLKDWLTKEFKAKR